MTVLNDTPEILLKDLGEISGQISRLLASTENFGQSEIEKLDGLYALKSGVLDRIHDFRASAAAKKYFSDKALAHNWDEAIGQIMAWEKTHLNIIENILEAKQSGLRNILSQKSLLIYSKENPYGY